MKTSSNSSLRRGFTLMELMVAMAITTIIISVLVGITSLSMDTWNKSRAEIRASRQGKALIDAMGADFESMISRRGNQFEWLYAALNQDLPGDKTLSSNAAQLIFFTAAVDKYAAADTDQGGDVSCVSYELAYQDPVSGPLSTDSNYQTFALYRLLVEPDVAFRELLGKPDLKNAFGGRTVNAKENFVCENIYQFTLKFNVEVQPPVTGTTVPPKQIIPVTLTQGGMGSAATGTTVSPAGSVRLIHDGLEIKDVNGAELSTGTFSPEQIKAGRIVSVDISVTVLNDTAINQLRVRNFASDDDKAEFIASNSYNFSKLVPVTSM